MKNRILIILIGTIFAFYSISCNRSINYQRSGVDLKFNTTLMKNIHGVKYNLTSDIVIKSDVSADEKNFHIENNILFQGMEKDIEMVINTSDFAKIIDFEKINEFLIKEVSFSLSENNDEIYLEYLVTLDSQEQNLTLTLQKNGFDWILI